MKNIYVGNLSFDATEDALRQVFEAHGEVQKVAIITDRETGRSRGFGFVEMSDDGAADTAISQLNGSDMGGRKRAVNEARPRRQ